MLLEQELSFQKTSKDTVLTIGVFDGVHLGHKYLLDAVKERAKRTGALSAVLTFRQHPDHYLSPEKELPYLTSLEERVRRLKNAGMDEVIIISFNKEMADIEASDFMQLLLKYLNLKALVIGPDFACGKDRKGNEAYLKELGKKLGFEVISVAPVVKDGEVISSTAIRRALAQGDMKKVKELSSHYFSIGGPVVTGFGRGKGLGFPTANLDVDQLQALPPNGVYVTLAYIDDKVYQALTNIGIRPTFDSGNRSIEVFLLDYEGNLYGKEMKIELVERLRDEKRFASVAELVQQIARDIERGKEILNSLGK